MQAHGLARLTTAVAVVTALAWVAGLGFAGSAELQGGFIPLRARLGGADFAVPFALTPLTATLVHAGLLHLGFNLLLFVFCGRQIEPVIGPARFALLYVVGAYAAAAGQYVVAPLSPVPMVGASGAISAVLALYALLFSRSEVRAFGPIGAHGVRALWLAAGWIGIQALIAFAQRPGGAMIATAAHVGGFLAGLVLARPLLASRWRQVRVGL